MENLIRLKAPDFTSSAIMADGSVQGALDLHTHIKGKYALLLFYPLDFTFVCPSELIALNNRIGAFKEKNTEVIGISIDSHFTHLAWRNTPVDKGGIGKLNYPLVSDMSHNIMRDYGVKANGNSVALRAGFIIDDKGIIRHQTLNDLPIGRNMDEFLRLIDAVQFHEKHGEVCPAGWHKNDQGMKESAEGVAQYLSENSDKL
ncbi:MAG: alkyl hydroperoxide reductase [Legionellales bacterium]|nr:MAG: alkyl hydroperoxide reductase [Legionellales bacterium]